MLRGRSESWRALEEWSMATEANAVRLYDGETDSLMRAELSPQRVSLLPGEGVSPGVAVVVAGSRALNRPD